MTASLIDKALSCVGLMRVAEHERELKRDAGWLETTARELNKATTDRDDWRAKHASVCAKLNDMTAKFKRAATDLAAQATLVSAYESALGFSFDGPCPICEGIEGCSHFRTERIGAEISRAASHEYAALEAEIAALRPDALAMRRKRQRDRELKAAKAAGKVQP